MTATEPELIALLKKLRYDLTDMQGKVSEALRMAGTLDLPDRVEHKCGCGRTFNGQFSLAEHVYYSHAGPVPQHILEAEALAAEPQEQA